MNTSSEASLRVQSPRPTVTRRLWFGWVAFWAWFFTATMSPLLVLHSAFEPTTATLRRWMRPWARLITGMSGIRLDVEQRAPLPEGPVIFVANHANSLDIMTTMLGLDRPFLYMARHEVRSWPFVGWVLEKSACLFINRDNPRQAVRDLREAASRVQAGDSVLLFPEGGRGHDHGLQPFMRGPFMLAVEAGVPLVPVTLVGNTGVLAERSFAAQPGRVRLVTDAAIPTEGLSRSDTAELAERVRRVVQAELATYGEPAELEGH
ncbi:MAG: lysophospholipid acyltransferase family protein [Bacteroidota bacterium]